MARRGRRHRLELNADVNVVSLIDVMLLLLVIFMITAPMMQGGVDITLPKAESKPMESKDAVAITVNRAARRSERLSRRSASLWSDRQLLQSSCSFRS